MVLYQEYGLLFNLIDAFYFFYPCGPYGRFMVSQIGQNLTLLQLVDHYGPIYDPAL